jgi:hypothetical protein
MWLDDASSLFGTVGTLAPLQLDEVGCLPSASRSFIVAAAISDRQPGGRPLV